MWLSCPFGEALRTARGSLFGCLHLEGRLGEVRRESTGLLVDACPADTRRRRLLFHRDEERRSKNIARLRRTQHLLPPPPSEGGQSVRRPDEPTRLIITTLSIRFHQELKLFLDLEQASPYDRLVARGWESKSVEGQQDDARAPSSKSRSKLTPQAAALARQRESVGLNRQRVLQQLAAAQNSRHRQMLESALAELDRQLQQLDEASSK